MKQEEVIYQWVKGMRIMHIVHAKSHSRFRKLDRNIGLSSTIFAAIVSTAVFASIAKDDEDSNYIAIVAGIISILTVVFSATHSFLKYGELAERHRQAAAAFGNLRRSVEIDLETVKEGVRLPVERFKEINVQWSDLERTAPACPQNIHDRVSKMLRNEQGSLK